MKEVSKPMSIFNFYKKKREIKSYADIEPNIETPIKRGISTACKIELDSTNIESVCERFIAFDVETTGLSPMTDRIVELGVVIFQDGKVEKTFSSLVNPGVSLSKSASAVNHITNEMLLSAPLEKEIYPRLIEFLGEALYGNIIMCAHNAKFDFDFLSNTLSRLGFDADIKYIDTLSLAKKYLRGLNNYKQKSIETHLGLTNTASHRAVSDAENCGRILFRLLDIANESIQTARKQIEQSRPTLQELEVCAYIQRIITEQGGDAKLLRFRKNSRGYVDISCLYNFLKVKFTKKGGYILVKKNCIPNVDYITESCIQSEGGTDYVRVFFSSPFDLKPLSKYIYKSYEDCYRSMEQHVSYSSHARQKVENSVRLMCALSEEEVASLLKTAGERKYIPVTICMKDENKILRDDVKINAAHNRVPLSEIKNSDNWDKGFTMGYPYWEKGEKERKAGRLEEAITQFDKARYYGYAAPALYISYAVLYHQLKDYCNEIVILDEGITRMPEQASRLEARREKAIELLFAQQERERKASEKAKQKIEKLKQKEDAAVQLKHPSGRAIVQMDDAGNIIKEFETIAAAVKEVGVSSKCIRDAASGVQKRAGGFRWKYKE